MAKMLRHVKTGEIWPMNPNLARHPDVEVFDQPDPQFAAAIAADDGATLGDVMKSESAAPAAATAHEFEDVPDFVPPPVDEVAEKKAAIQAKAAAAAAVEVDEDEDEEPADDDADDLDDLDMDLDDLDE